MTNSIKHVTTTYVARVRRFRPNARLYLMNVLITGLAVGVFQLLFNFYILSLGFDEAVLGRLITISSFTSLLVALPIGYLADILGRKKSLVLSGLMSSLAIAGMVLFPSEKVFYTLQLVMGIAKSLAMITMAPFLMENSDEEERTYLFSLGSGLKMFSDFAGSWIGGYLPTWIALRAGFTPTDSPAYAKSLLIVSVVYTLGLIPLLFLHRNRNVEETRSIFAPLQYAQKKPKLLAKLVVPTLITSIGAGLIIPFMNVFFRTVHQQSDATIGTVFAWGSLAMAIGFIIAPPLAERFGKIQVVVASQIISVPFLIMLGFSPWFWLSAQAYFMRLGLMNMSNPVYQAFVMEHVDTEARATVASLTSMAWSFGWVFSPMISGYLQVNYGFDPVFFGTIFMYIIAITMYWIFFLRGQAHKNTKNSPFSNF